MSVSGDIFPNIPDPPFYHTSFISEACVIKGWIRNIWSFSLPLPTLLSFGPSLGPLEKREEWGVEKEKKERGQERRKKKDVKRKKERGRRKKERVEDDEE